MVNHSRRCALSYGKTGVMLFASLLLLGCATGRIDTARESFYSGNIPLASEQIEEVSVDSANEVLLLMERGTILQAAGNYEKSAQDFIRAAERLKDLETYSLSEGGASWVVNERVRTFEGVPFERAMLHNFTALNHLALGAWEHAAVEARRIIQTQHDETRGDYPDDAFSRYMAGLGLTVVDDYSNAALQFRLASNLVSDIAIDALGWVLPKDSKRNVRKNNTARLTCFVLLGESPTGEALFYGLNNSSQASPHANIYIAGKHVGRSYTLTDIQHIAIQTANLEALRKAVKEAARIAAKEAIAAAFDNNDLPLVGFLIRLILIGLLEHPDTRRWETLPRWLQVSTVSVPDHLDEKDLSIHIEGIEKTGFQLVTSPLQQYGKHYIMFVRTLPAPITTQKTTSLK